MPLFWVCSVIMIMYLVMVLILLYTYKESELMSFYFKVYYLSKLFFKW